MCCLSNDVHEGDTNERKKKKCEIGKREEEREKAADHA
jgi:hypothetical protein